MTAVRRRCGDTGQGGIILGVFARSNLRVGSLFLHTTFALQCGLRGFLGPSLALLGLALPLEQRRSISLCHSNSLGRAAPAEF
jgi:hypothetical protein